ncbi:hypothetical protein ACFXAQ_32995 [Streptomyces olivaceus]|uniref:hypothetical protein n=1 Tax=Streptomyces olivaceus TaxID=47716 RepID=UPI003695CFAB
MLLTDEDPCSAVAGPADAYCRRGQSGGVDTAPSGPDELDPFTTLAQSVASAADWTARQLGKLVGDEKGSIVDFTNHGFLAQYAVVFAASTILVLVLWILAVIKRAVRGVPMTTAMGEAIGLLWFAVAVCAFTPLILYVVVTATDAVTHVLVQATGGDSGGLFKSLGSNLKDGNVGGGPFMLLAASVVTIALCGALALLIVMRALALYVGALLGVVVYSGLVDRNLWGRVRRWIAGMVALILAKPVTVIVLGLAAAMEGDGEAGPVVTGIGVSAVTLMVAIYIIMKFPGLGDSFRAARMTARTVGGAAGVVTGGTSASRNVMQGIQTHGNRANRSSSVPGPSQGISGGLGAHGSRTPKNSKDAGRGGKPEK